jgi:hypothetical protein
MAQLKAVFYLPLRDNDGRDLTAEKDYLEMEMYVHFVGWTFLGVVQGAYGMADGTRVVDEHRAYSIILDETRIPEVEEVLRDFKSKTKQEAIYLEVQQHVSLRLV